MKYAELELTLRSVGESYTANLRFFASENTSGTDIAKDVQIKFDTSTLLGLHNNWVGYGRELTGQLFANAKMREAWAEIRGFIAHDDTLLRLRLHIEPSADALHSLYWELLQDPKTYKSLCRSERVLLTRYLASHELLAPITPPDRNTLRALVLVANPSDPERYNLTPLDVDGEISRVRTALDPIPTTVLARVPHGQGATLEALIRTLRIGYPLLSLTCHGRMVDGEPLLYFEHAAGHTDTISGTKLVQRIADLPSAQRPLLIILAACQTAGRGQQYETEFLAALAPQLARAGVGAVIGMQGNAPVTLVEALLPQLLSELRENSQIDRALALARTTLADDQPWWMPVLFMHMRDGRLWTESPTVPPNPVPQVAAGLNALVDLIQNPNIRTASTEFRKDFATSRAQVAKVIAFKDIHDLLHIIQFQCYIPLEHEAHHFPDEDVACDSIAEYALSLRQKINDIQEAFTRAPEILGKGTWIAELRSADANIHQALAQRDPDMLKKAIQQIDRVLGRHASFINTNLTANARNLRLQDLVKVMNQIQAHLHLASTDHQRLARFMAGVDALSILHQQIEQMIDDHDDWQEIDRQVRQISAILPHNTDELKFSWPYLRECLSRLLLIEATWVQPFQQVMSELDMALENLSERSKAIFHRCSRLINERFFKVDVDLKRLCNQLRELDDPLAELERMLT